MEIFMNDMSATLQQCKEMVQKFVEERDWNKFHTPKNLSMDISIEAAELMEKFLWVDGELVYKKLKEERTDIEDELADTFMALLCFANVCNIDLAKSFARKLEKTAQKYPVEQVKGKSHKYTYYQNDAQSKD